MRVPGSADLSWLPPACLPTCQLIPATPFPAVIANLEHRHSYVRKNAVLALAAIYRLPKGELLVPDAPDLVEKMLQNEQVGVCVCWGWGVGWWEL